MHTPASDPFPCIGTVDVAVIGGGPAGAACALALRTCTSHSTALIEATTYEGVRIGENVSSALLALLDYLDIKERFLASGAYIHSVAVEACWGRAMPVQLHSLNHWSGAGYLLDRRVFDATLAAQVHARGGKVYLACRLEKLFSDEVSGGWILHVRHTSGRRFALRARFLVDASGRKACIARRLGAVSTCYDSLIGISRFFQLAGDRPRTQELLIESTRDGWWYSAPLPGRLLVMSLMTDAAIWRSRSGPPAEKWLAFVRHAPRSASRIRRAASAVDARVTIRPAYSHLLHELAGENWLSVGDASASFDPLSALGIGFALHSACHAARAIDEYLTTGKQQKLHTYIQGVREQFRRYLPTWQACYACETRWSDAPFWQARLPPGADLPASKTTVPATIRSLTSPRPTP